MSHVIVRISTPLRQLTSDADEVEIEGQTVAKALEELGAKYEGLLDRLLDKDGELRSFVNIYIGENNIRNLDGMNTELEDGDVLAIVLAVAGG